MRGELGAHASSTDGAEGTVGGDAFGDALLQLLVADARAVPPEAVAAVARFERLGLFLRVGFGLAENLRLGRARDRRAPHLHAALNPRLRLRPLPAHATHRIAQRPRAIGVVARGPARLFLDRRLR